MASNRRQFRGIVGAICLLLLGIVGGCGSSNQPADTGKRDYSFWPSLPDEPRVQFLTSFNSSQDVQPKQSKFDEMIYGKGETLPIAKPYGVAMWDGKIYVCDIRSAGVTVLDLRRKIVKVMGARGSGEVQKAVDITIAPDGTKYVVDQMRAAVVAFDAKDEFAGMLAPKEFNPVGVAVWGTELFVADFKAQVVKVLDRRSGQQLRVIGEPGGNDGQFVGPLGVCTDAEGNIVVTDVLKCRVQKFTRDGKLLSAMGRPGNTPGDFVRPKHAVMDRNGLLYVVDAAFNNVQIFDEEGRVLMYFGSPGMHPGAMDLPAGVCIDDKDMDLFEQYIHPAFQAEHLMVVTNQFGGHKVAVYAVGHLKAGKTTADIMLNQAAVASGTEDGKTGATTRPVLPPVDFVPTTQSAGGARAAKAATAPAAPGAR